MNKFKHNVVVIDSKGLTKYNWFIIEEIVCEWINPPALKQLWKMEEKEDVQA